MKNNLAANVDSNISLYARYRGAIYSTYYVKKTFDANLAESRLGSVRRNLKC